MECDDGRVSSSASLVLFDLDDTLLDHRGAVATGILQHVGSLGEPYVGFRDEKVQAYWHALEERHYHRYLTGELDFAGQRRARAMDFADAYGVTLDDAEADDWFDAYFERYRDSWALFPDALPCLDRLAAAGCRTGVITNGDPDFQSVKIARLVLGERFEHIVASGAVGIAKPAAGIFHHACALYDVDPSEAVYVGDRLLTDAIGAARAGLAGVWLNRNGDDVPPGAIGHGDDDSADPLAMAEEAGVRVIASLDELPAVLN